MGNPAVMSVIRNGKKVGINVSDFNPEIHQPYVESEDDEEDAPDDKPDDKSDDESDDESEDASDDGSAPGDEADEPKSEDEPPFNLSEVTAGDAIEFIGEIEDLEMLAEFEREETEGKERVTVLRALSKRCHELGVGE